MPVSKRGREKYTETKRIIQQAMNEKQLVLFVGAGASVDAGMPSWSQAIYQIAGKLGIKEVGDSDNLKIPQYYYNDRGKKEYVQLMRRIFRYKEKLDPQPVHDKIIAFNTDTIITTNYDHLIEDAAEKNREFIQVFSADVDLPYRQAGKELIKMHGDFEHNNFVLKEDDYLHYQRDFKLIENYVKSLIGVKTVLFIGYSLNDPDVKQILTWTNEILDEDVQRAYLIEAKEEYDQFKSEYFRNLGVNLIYSRELLNEDKGVSANLLGTLDFLLENECHEQSLPEVLYDYLKPFLQMNYTYFRYIEKAFYDRRVKKHLILRENGYIYPVKNDKEGERFVRDLIRIIRNEDKKIEQREILQKLRCIFSQSHIQGVIYGKQRVEILKAEDTELEQAIFNFDYSKLEELKDRKMRTQINKDAHLYLQQATICAFLYDYAAAYTYLNNAIDILYQKKDYAQYYITLFSKQNIGKIILWDSLSRYDESFLNSVKKETEAMDLDKTLSTIPDLGNNNNTFLKELQNFKFAAELFYDAYKASNKAKKEASQTYMVYGGLPGYQELRIRVFDYYYYCLKNHILADRFRENNEIFDIYVRSLLASLSAPDKGSNNTPWPASSNIHAAELTKEDIYILLRYGNTDVLINITDEYNTKILNVSDIAKQYINTLVTTVPQILNSSLRFDKSVFDRLLIVLSHIQLTESYVMPIFESIKEVSDARVFYQHRNAMEIFFQELINQQLYTEELLDAAKDILTILFHNCTLDEDYYHLIYNEIVLLINFCYRGNRPYDNENIITELMKQQRDLLIIELYTALSDKAQKHIKKTYSEYLNDKRLKAPYIYARMVLDGLRSPDAEIEAESLAFFEETNKKRLEGVQEVYYSNPLNILANLYMADLIIDRERFAKVVAESEDESIKWLIDAENYDYSRFDVKWLRFCHDEFLIKLASNEKIARNIVKKFCQEHESGKLEKSEIDKVLRFFIVNRIKAEEDVASE